MGSAACAFLAQRGVSALGFEQFSAAHDRGASHGKSRIIREAYFEHPAYVPLVQRAYELWKKLEQKSGRKLLQITGGLMLGPPDGELVRGVLKSAREHHLEHELLSAREVMKRYPFHGLGGRVGVFEPKAGVLFPEACVLAHLEASQKRGARLHLEEPVLSWHAGKTSVEVKTSQATYTSHALVVTGGPWAGQVLSELGLPLSVERIPVFWFHPVPGHEEKFKPDRFPIYIVEHQPEIFFYGIPSFPPDGMKAARHHGGEICAPDTVRRSVDEEEIAGMRSLLEPYLPDACGPLAGTTTCLYTNTPDQHFIIDCHPEFENVFLACGFSGHGFKFAPVVGEMLADLVQERKTRDDASFFSLARF